jgi:uncharacterized membrane protein SpoIIM required for sporulation
MISTIWHQKRRAYWARTQELLARSGNKGVSALAHAELQELALLYRQTASDLATIRQDPASRSLAQHLNQLLARAHNLIYMGRRSRFSGVVAFYRDTFPEVFHETLWYTLTAAAIFFATTIAAFMLSISNPGFQRFFLGAGMMETIEKREMWTHSIVSIKPLASSAIMTNNLSVSLTAFAMGITAGIGTVYMLAFNGVLFGTVNAACWQAGMAEKLWSFVAPHSVLELPAIFIAGGAGLLLAKGMLFPGYLPRRVSLAQEGAKATRLALGIIPMLIIAGTVEGFISPTDLPIAVKAAVACVLAVLLALYLKRKTPRGSRVTASSAPSLPDTGSPLR